MKNEKKTWSTPQLLDLSSVDAARGKISTGAEQAKAYPARAEVNYQGPGSRGFPTTTGTVS